MIIYNSIKSNSFNKICIKKYEETLNFNISKCPCCNSYDLIKWGSYTRNVIYYKNGRKYEETIEIKRIMCKSCNKTQSIIPNFLVPYKVHTVEYITEVVKSKLTRANTYDIVCEEYQISRQLLKYWLNCFEEHFTRISTTLCEIKVKKVIRIIIKDIYKFIYDYYIKNRLIYMMYVSSDFNKPILRWAPT